MAKTTTGPTFSARLDDDTLRMLKELSDALHAGNRASTLREIIRTEHERRFPPTHVKVSGGRSVRVRK